VIVAHDGFPLWLRMGRRFNGSQRSLSTKGLC
jgi:hypothetical protein